MSDYISRQDAIDALSRGEGCGNICRRSIECIPSADVPDRNVGRWIPWKYHNGFRCEHCNEPVDNKHNFCPNCGADMRGEQE